MPQFDPNTFATQAFWLIVCFAALYVIVWRLLLPKLSDIFEARQRYIEDDLTRAEKLKAEAEEVLRDYRSSLEKARAEAQSSLKAVADELAAEAARQIEVQGAALTERGKDAEARIAAAKAEALGNVKAVAAESAGLAVSRLIGVTVGEDELAKAVDAARGGAGQAGQGGSD